MRYGHNDHSGIPGKAELEYGKLLAGGGAPRIRLPHRVMDTPVTAATSQDLLPIEKIYLLAARRGAESWETDQVPWCPGCVQVTDGGLETAGILGPPRG